MALTRAYISEATGFDNGDLFQNEEQVRQYFTPDNIAAMFGECALSSEELHEMAEAVIDNGWHMSKTTTVKYVALAPHSYHYCGYDNTDSQYSSGYTYVREPDPTDRTRYADRPVTHVELRPDVRIISNRADGCSVEWDPDEFCPFVYLP